MVSGECAWCGAAIGGDHQPDCKSLSRNYAASRKPKRRTPAPADPMPPRRPPLYQRKRRSYGTAPEVDSEPADKRTEVQKRFAAIAEELKDGE